MQKSFKNPFFDFDKEAELRILYSGGIESSVMVGKAVEEGLNPTPVYVSIGTRWEDAEIKAAKNYLEALETGFSENMVIIKSRTNQNYPDWVYGGEGFPISDAGVSSLELPDRNETLIREALNYKDGQNSLNIFIGTTADNPFDDGTAEFFLNLEAQLFNEKKRKVKIIAPLHHLNKKEVMELGKRFPLELTLSCVAPIEGKPCKKCIKCAIRNEAFLLAG